jgi:hypothetical protein
MFVSDWRFVGAVGKVEFELLQLDLVSSAARTSTSQVMWRLACESWLPHITSAIRRFGQKQAMEMTVYGKHGKP